MRCAVVADNVLDFKAIGKRVKILRIQKDISQEKLAEDSDISVTYLSNIENAHSKASLATFVKLANALRVGVDSFLCDSVKATARAAFEKDIADILSDCDEGEVRILTGSLRGIKEALRECERYKERAAFRKIN